VTPLPRRSDRAGRQAWWARLALVLTALGLIGLVAAAASHAVWLFLVAALAMVLLVAAGYWFLALRGWRRTMWLVVVLAIPSGLVVLLTLNHVLGPLLVCAGVFALAGAAGRIALSTDGATEGTLESASPPLRHPVIFMNPRSGGGKVARFDPAAKAAAIGAEVVMIMGPGSSTSPNARARPWPTEPTCCDTGVHYPGDVIAGALIGAGIGSLTYHVARRF
jgi:hypothetical protein